MNHRSKTLLTALFSMIYSANKGQILGITPCRAQPSSVWRVVCIIWRLLALITATWSRSFVRAMRMGEIVYCISKNCLITSRLLCRRLRTSLCGKSCNRNSISSQKQTISSTWTCIWAGSSSGLGASTTKIQRKSCFWRFKSLKCWRSWCTRVN